MRALSAFLLLFAVAIALPAATHAQDPPEPERWYPLSPGDEWVYRWRDCQTIDKSTTCDPYYYLKQRVVGDTLLAGVPHALVSFERFTLMGDLLAEALAAVRVVADPPSPAVEVALLQGAADAMEGGFGSWCDGRPLPLEVGTGDTVTIGGFPYPLIVAEVPVHCDDPPYYVEEHTRFALDLGVVWGYGYANVPASQVHNTRGSELVYANVGGVVYGEGNPVSVEPPTEVPPAFAIEAVYPNPFRDAAAVAFILPAPEVVVAAVYDALGRRVWARDLGRLPAGRHRVELGGAGLAPGVYVVRGTTASGASATQRVVRVE